MTGRAMIVTGASAGVGRALAARAVKAGYGVLGVGRRGTLLEELKDSLQGAAGTFELLALDLLAADAPKRVVTTALQRFGRIDVLVNNAGTVSAGPIGEQSDAALREQFTLHAIVPLALLREALPALRATRGQVFFVGSGVARVPVAGLGAYPSAKAAVRSMARIARNELRSTRVAVTYVDPGAVDTEFMARAGLTGAPPHIAVSPHDVAAKILHAVATRPRVVNAAPWQTTFVALAELFPSLTDAVLTRFPDIVGSRPLPSAGITTEAPAELPDAGAPARPSAPPPASTPSPEPDAPPASAFEAALEPLERRMERMKLSAAFVARSLQSGATLETGELAMRWAGMPNKHERSLTLDVLEALTAAQFLARGGDGRYTVLRGVDESGYQ